MFCQFSFVVKIGHISSRSFNFLRLDFLHAGALFVADTKGPRLTFPPNLRTHTLSNPWFNWSSDEPADKFECALDDPTNWELCGNGKSGVWQQYNVPDGDHRFYVRGTDDLGNTGPEISHPFTVGKQILLASQSIELLLGTK